MPLIAIITLVEPVLDGWLQFIQQRPELSRTPPRDIINPFTMQPTTFVHPPSEADVSLGGQIVGSVVPSSWFDDNRELLVFAMAEEDPQIAALTERAAEALGATIEWVGPDHPQRERCQ